jgi:hypothetical protein
MKRNLSYRFKPDAKRLDLGFLFTVVLFVAGGYLLLRFAKGIMGVGGILGESQSQSVEGVDSITGPVPVGVDEVKLADRLNRLCNYMDTLWTVDQSGMINILSDLSSSELDWIYVKFGNRIYQHGFLDVNGKQDLKLFGWFDRRLNVDNANTMEEIWSKSSYNYLPDNPHSEGILW